MNKGLFAFAHRLRKFRNFCALEILGKRFMRTRLACENEVSAACLDCRANWLIGKQVVTKIDRFVHCVGCCVFFEPASRSSGFTVLLVMPVLWHDEFGRQRYNLVVARGDDHRAENRMEVLRFPVASITMRAIIAVDFV